ncbi:carbohydrate ABC transporter permease [Pelagibacterium lentulum]|uniref:Maltose/maltodextrin transport system permease protein MalG n=1 Tax=Pelagibacterium lentulum TaxID=2029865 RepID=A0A916VXF5_9HYPH|nr:carbohydrate ABC transporter permease [Pelagibacterium lentulum]GGA49592.1 membrane protein [Pelagibacterium lentulum]
MSFKLSRKWRRTIISWLLLSPLIILVLFPFAVMLITALKPPGEVLRPNWWPSEFRWSNFITMWDATNFGRALWNSIYVAFLSTAIALVVSIPAAYAMSRFRFAAKGFFRQFLLISQMLSPIVLVIGLFRLVVWLGLLDNVNSVVFVYAAFAIAFTVWMLQSYFATIPKDLEEAAWIEGASPWQALITVFLPLALPAITVTAIFAFINAWNEFVIALTMLRSQDSYTLPIQVFSLVAGRYTIEWHHVMAAAFVATLPVAIVFAWLQRYLVRGLALGAVK